MICPTQQDQEVVEMLLSLARPGQAGDSPQAQDYDWTSPVSFNREQLQRFGVFADRLAEKCGEILWGLTKEPVKLQAAPMRQHFQWKIVKSDLSGGYFVAFNDESGKPAGFFRLAGATAAQWVGKLLGSAAGGEAREMSSLESSLLMDMISPLIGAFGVCLDLPAGKGLRAASPIARQYEWPAGQDSREYAEFSWTLGDSAEPVGAFYVASQWLAGNCGQKDEPRRPAEEIRKDILKHLDRMFVSGRVWLGTATVAVRDVITLKTDDVLLLSTEVGEPVEFHVEGRCVCLGTPASRDGNYALQVTKRT